jgi:DNA-binding NarL/FixJ family response regulator
MAQPPPKPSAGLASYRIAEVHRLRGDFENAEQAYRAASKGNQSVQPGLALLRLAQGRVGDARSAIRDALDETSEPAKRARLLDAQVQISLAASDIGAAQMAAEELVEIARHHGMPFLVALAEAAMGSVLLAKNEYRAALAKLRSSWQSFCDMDLPYEAAKVRVQMALASRGTGNLDAADLELAAAREVFARLGANPDLARVEALLRQKAAEGVENLTGREVEVLRLVASGMTNRGIAGKLKISEKTVARHVSNIFVKLDVSSRAAATAYAYKHELVKST